MVQRRRVDSSSGRSRGSGRQSGSPARRTAASGRGQAASRRPSNSGQAAQRRQSGVSGRQAPSGQRSRTARGGQAYVRQGAMAGAAGARSASAAGPLRKLLPIVAAAIVAICLVAFIGSQVSRCSQRGSLVHDSVARISAAADQGFSVSLGFIGDINFGDDYTPMRHLAQIGSTDIADGIDQRYIDLMRGVDLMWLNNEFVYSTRGAPLPGKTWTFRSSPEHVQYLHDLGADIVGLANNHTYDYGGDAFEDTLATLKDAGVPYVGAGYTIDEAKAPVYLQAGGLTVAYVAASCAEVTVYTPEATDTEPGILWCYDDDLFLESIREAAENADYVVALPHWGDEYTTTLQKKQTESARAYIDAGADVVIGAHPHILQGIEYYNGKPILYSLGNFWFNSYDIDTMLAELRISGFRDLDGSLGGAKVQLVLHPGTQSNVYTALADTPERREQIFGDLEDISPGISIDEDGVVHEA